MMPEEPERRSADGLNSIRTHDERSLSEVGGIVGGSLIGGSAGILLLFNGDIMGISGILSNTLVQPKKSFEESQFHWRWIWIAGFSSAVHLHVNYLSPHALEDDRSQASDVPIPSVLAHIVGGFLVGMGTRIGNGCTTGHGICGMGRFSPRSLVATVNFTGVAILTRFFLSPLRPWASSTEIMRSSEAPDVSPIASALFLLAATTAALLSPTGTRPVKSNNDLRKKFGAWLSGVAFAFGLAISGMTKNSKVHDFLCLSGFAQHSYDPTLIAVMATGILASWLSYQFIPGFSSIWSADSKKNLLLKTPISLPEGTFNGIPTNRTIDLQLLAGTAIFGLGWGVTGICPGPALYAAAAGVVDSIVAWIPAFCLGSYVGNHVKQAMFGSKAKSKTC